MVLLTGASGLLGKAITFHLALQQAQVFTIGRQDTNRILCDLSLEIPLIDANNVQLVIHAAGKAHTIPKTIADKQVFFDINLTGTLNLLKGLENLEQLPKSFVFISSVAVYGQESGENIIEQAPLNAKDPYGLSKIQAEEVVTQWCNKNKVICTILRLPLLAGDKPPGNLGTMIKGIQQGYYLNIGGGRSKKSMVLAKDVAGSILKVAEIGGIYNLTDGHHPSFSELSSHISNQLGIGKPKNLPLWMARIIANFGDLFGNIAPLNSSKLKKITSDLTFDDSKAREAFGWNPIPVLEGFIIN
jgi:nucleoside-diphosphate-sugar epimerase